MPTETDCSAALSFCNRSRPRLQTEVVQMLLQKLRLHDVHLETLDGRAEAVEQGLAQAHQSVRHWLEKYLKKQTQGLAFLYQLRQSVQMHFGTAEGG